jgi:conjugal transfer ATP-binding protein TraC
VLSFVKLQQALLRRNPISSFFTPLQYDKEEGLYRLKDNAIGFGFAFSPSVVINDNIGDSLAAVFQAKGMPANTNVNFSLYASNDVHNHLIYKKNKLRGLDPDLPDDVRKVFEEAISREVDFIQKGVKSPFETHNETMVRNSTGWITVTVPVPEQNKKKPDSKRYKKKLDALKAELLDLKSRLSSTLSSGGVGVTDLEPETLINLVASLINTSEDARWRDHYPVYDPRVDIDKQLAEKRTIVDRENSSYLVVGDGDCPRYWKVLTQDRLPPMASASMSAVLLGIQEDPNKFLPGNAILSCNLFFSERDQFKSTVRNQKVGATVQKKFSENHAKQYDDLEYVENQVKDGGLPVQLLFSVAVCDDTEEGVKDKSTRAINHLSSLGYGFQEDDNILPALFFSMMPFGATTNPKVVEFIDRYKKMTAHEAVRFLPVCSQWKGIGAPEMSFFSRNGELMNYDIFSFDSYNGLMAAQTGKGKSVASNFLLQSYLLSGGQVWVIDVGDSYRNHCEISGGNYYDFGDSSQFNFDPLLSLGELDPKDFKDQIDMVTGVVSQMIVVNDALNDYQVSFLSKIISEVVAKKGVDSKLSDIAMALRTSGKELDITRMGEQLEVFYEKYKEFFTGTTKVDLGEGHFNVIELFNLKSKPHLAKVILYQSIMAIERSTFFSMRDPKKQNRKKLCLIDEGWQFLMGDSSTGGKSDKAVEAFLTSAYRQFRKAKAGIWLVVQSIGDVYLNPNAQPIIDNSANKFLLGQDDSTVEMLKREQKLALSSDYEYELLKSIDTHKGKFSELFLLSDKAKGIARLALDPYRLMMFSTDGDDKEKIRRFREQGLNTDYSIRCAIGEMTLEQARKEQRNV